MKRSIVTIIFLAIVSCSYCQSKTETINEFLDGYAWKSKKCDYILMVFHKNIVYLFQADKNGIFSQEAKSYLFANRNTFTDAGGEFKITPISLDSLLKDKELIFVNPINKLSFMKVFYIEDNREYFEDPYINYESAIFTLKFFKNNRDEIQLNRSYQPTPSYRQRIINPPHFVQEFIKSLKKESLTTISTKSIIYSVPEEVPTMHCVSQGDEVEVLEEKANWLRVRYYGEKTIEGWVEKNDVVQ